MLLLDSHTSQGGKGELVFYGEKGPERLRSRTEETQLCLELLVLAQALGLQFSCQYGVIVPSVPPVPYERSSSFTTCLSMQRVSSPLAQTAGKLSDTGSGADSPQRQQALPRGSRCLLGAEITFWALSFPHQLLRPTADAGREGVSPGQLESILLM